MKAFISYSHRDAAMLDRLRVHLAMLRREGVISEWHDRDIAAGGLVDAEIMEHLDSSQLFLALVSPDFLHSAYCYDKEMSRALARHAAGQLLVIPIIIETCDWQASALEPLKAIPRDGTPVSQWPDQNSAWLDVVKELRRILTSKRAASSALAERSAEPIFARQTGAAPARGTAAAALRVKRAFDRIDRDDFRRETYREIHDHFERSLQELDGQEGLRARFQSITATSFTCTLLNPQIKQGRGGESHLTVHSSPEGLLGEIYYSFAAHAPANTANGGFRIAADDYQLLLKHEDFRSDERDRRLSPQDAATRLWDRFLSEVGVSYG